VLTPSNCTDVSSQNISHVAEKCHLNAQAPVGGFFVYTFTEARFTLRLWPVS